MRFLLFLILGLAAIEVSAALHCYQCIFVELDGVTPCDINYCGWEPYQHESCLAEVPNKDLLVECPESSRNFPVSCGSSHFEQSSGNSTLAFTVRGCIENENLVDDCGTEAPHYVIVSPESEPTNNRNWVHRIAAETCKCTYDECNDDVEVTQTTSDDVVSTGSTDESSSTDESTMSTTGPIFETSTREAEPSTGETEATTGETETSSGDTKATTEFTEFTPTGPIENTSTSMPASSTTPKQTTKKPANSTAFSVQGSSMIVIVLICTFLF